MNEGPTLASASLNSSHVQLLEQLSDQSFWDLARDIAHATLPVQLPQNEYLACELGKGRCVLPLSILCQVVPPPHQFTLFPAMPLWMLGVVAWQDETIVVVDLDAYLLNSEARPRAEGMLLIVQSDDFKLGLFVPVVVGTTFTIETEKMVSSEQAPLWYSPLCADSIQGVYACSYTNIDYLVLNIPVMINDVVQHIRMTASYE